MIVELHERNAACYCSTTALMMVQLCENQNRGKRTYWPSSSSTCTYQACHQHILSVSGQASNPKTWPGRRDPAEVHPTRKSKSLRSREPESQAVQSKSYARQDTLDPEGRCAPAIWMKFSSGAAQATFDGFQPTAYCRQVQWSRHKVCLILWPRKSPRRRPWHQAVHWSK